MAIDIEASVNKFRDITRRIDQDLVNLFRTGLTDASDSQIAAVTSGVNRILTKNKLLLDELIVQEVKKAYITGGVEAVVAFSKAFHTRIAFMLNQTDAKMISTLTDEMTLNFAEAMSGVKRSTARLLSMAQKERIQATFAEGYITGKTRKKISGFIADSLRENFIGMTDRGGRTWSIESYSEMLTRTKMRETANRGLMTRLADRGCDLAIISSHGSDHEACRKHEGEIISVTGQTKVYQGKRILSYDELAALGEIWHPNCKHRLLPFQAGISDVAENPPTSIEALRAQGFLKVPETAPDKVRGTAEYQAALQKAVAGDEMTGAQLQELGRTANASKVQAETEAFLKKFQK